MNTLPNLHPHRQLVFIWSKLQLRVNSSKQALLDQSRQLMLSSTNVKSIFPFMGVIVAEVRAEPNLL